MLPRDTWDGERERESGSEHITTMKYHQKKKKNERTKKGRKEKRKKPIESQVILNLFCSHDMPSFDVGPGTESKEPCLFTFLTSFDVGPGTESKEPYWV